ncbi:hypothetical protein ONA70_14025 [Micromonospora yasonensis]|uniref:hypothetical protein n=1 Tax=Micromonospora yasonensis TaxID=1128667 RepID=UPI00222F55CB|nr:hypothetical protein [Micromonospora yasonensis]MCW3841219.1 hypothetical protein [Micromonospora yasonensis]
MRVKAVARLMVAALGVALGVVAPIGSGAAYADGVVGLGIDAYAEMVVDSAHGRLFFSQGRQRSGVRVTDLSGGAQRTIPDLPGASGMALSPDGSTLYVALADADAVAAIDTTTLAEKRRYSTGASTCPTWLAPAGGKIYIGYGCQSGKGKLGSIDVRGATPVVALDLPLNGQYYYPPLLRSTPANPNLLLLVNRSSVSFPISGEPGLYDVSSGTPSHVASLAGETCTGLHDAVLTADKVILGCSYLWDPQSNSRVVAAEHVAFSAADLSPAGTYPSGTWPTAVTTSPNGSFIVLGASESDSIHVERPDGTVVRRYALPPGNHLQVRGLAVSADSRTLYAVTTDQDRKNPALRVLTDFGTTGSSLLLSAPTTSTRAAPLTVQGKLAFVGATVSTPWTLKVAKQDITGGHPLPDVTTAADGSFSFSDTPLVGAANTYTVTFPGDATHPGTSQSATVQVSRAATALSVTAKATTGRRASVTAQLGATYTNRTVCLYAQPYGQARKTLTCGKVDGYGKLMATYPTYQRVTFSASFAGDERYAPAEASVRTYGFLWKPGVFRGY